MKGRKYQLLKYLDLLKSEDAKPLLQLINTHFIPEYSPSLDLQPLYPHLHVISCNLNEVIFQQGDEILDYFAVTEGNVIINKRNKLENNDNNSNTAKGPQLIGEYFYSTNRKREGTATIISGQATVLMINKAKFHQILSAQIQQYYSILKEISLFCEINRLTLEKAKLFCSSKLIYHRINDIFKPNDKEILILSDGECKVYDKRSETQVIINRYNCIGIEEYFEYKYDQKVKNNLVYKANSSKVKLISLSYTFIDKMPEHFINQLHFLLKSCLRRQNKSNHQKSHLVLPHIENTQKSIKNLQKESLSLNKQNKARQRRVKKSQSSQFFKGISSLQIKAFQKNYILGYINRDSVDSLKIQSGNQRPFKGYFEMKPCRPMQKNNNLPRKDWASYIRLKQIQKQNKRKEQDISNSGIINKSFLSENSKIFQNIYRKYQNFNKIVNLDGEKLSKIKLKKLQAKNI